MSELLSNRELPPGFTYPRVFLRVIELRLTNLEPWWIIGTPSHAVAPTLAN